MTTGSLQELGRPGDLDAIKNKNGTLTTVQGTQERREKRDQKGWNEQNTINKEVDANISRILLQANDSDRLRGVIRTERKSVQTHTICTKLPSTLVINRVS